MREIDKVLDAWQASLCKEVAAGALVSRNPVAHKFKAPLRSMVLREAVAWRTHDLLAQSLALYDAEHLLGARILVRSALETVAMLIYLNQLTRQVVEGDLSFHEFDKKTMLLLTGSRDGGTRSQAINIITIFQKCEKRYPGLSELYGTLSESAHPNFAGLCFGYSDVQHDDFVSVFSNKWASRYKPEHLAHIELCKDVFLTEYDDEWPEAFDALEHWIERNEPSLGAQS
jgi:hypothetical protein